MNILKDPLLHQQAERLEVGRKGEAWVAANERQKLENTPYAGSVEVSSSSQRISYDKKSRTLTGQPLYIEVKSTNGEPSLPSVDNRYLLAGFFGVKIDDILIPRTFRGSSVNPAEAHQ